MKVVITKSSDWRYYEIKEMTLEEIWTMIMDGERYIVEKHIEESECDIGIEIYDDYRE